MEIGALSNAPDLLDTEAVADLLGLPSARAVYSRRFRGDFPPAIQVGASLRWRRADIDAWLDARFEAEGDGSHD